MPKIIDHEEQRAELLDGAFDLFADQGYRAVSMRKLAGSLGVSTGTLYHYFGSKDDIFEQMVERLAQRDIFTAISAIPEDADTRLRLQLIFAWICANQAYLQRVLSLMFDFRRHRSDTAAEHLVEQAAQSYRLAFEEQVRPLGPEAWSLILGMLVGGQLEPGQANELGHLAALEALLASQLTPREA
ncbi:MAG: hypothetical protein CMP23_02410 [Rickettsiales bacterium]|nr:hypothetical protein [Rickettsiales bacterium]|tara:strand:- start:806 stop:1363 length:558 start_codon:yes stop_codon:yes gene_type:complete